jgi:hypothetical protein
MTTVGISTGLSYIGWDYYLGCFVSFLGIISIGYVSNSICSNTIGFLYTSTDYIDCNTLPVRGLGYSLFLSTTLVSSLTSSSDSCSDDDDDLSCVSFSICINTLGFLSTWCYVIYSNVLSMWAYYIGYSCYLVATFLLYIVIYWSSVYIS